MIQRIQTIFLLLAVILQALFLSFPLMHFNLENSITVDFYTQGMKDANNELVFKTILVLLLSIMIFALGFIAIFLYKKRIIQMRICIYNILLNIGLIGLIIFLTLNFTKHNLVVSQSYDVSIIFPIVNVILYYLAFRGIRKDEVLVKAYDRLR